MHIWIQGCPDNLMVKQSKGQGSESTVREHLQSLWFVVFLQISRRGSQRIGVILQPSVRSASSLLISSPTRYGREMVFPSASCSCPTANSTRFHFEELLCPLLSSHHTMGLTSPHLGAAKQNVPFPGHRHRCKSGQKNQTGTNNSLRDSYKIVGNWFCWGDVFLLGLLSWQDTAWSCSGHSVVYGKNLLGTKLTKRKQSPDMEGEADSITRAPGFIRA